MLGYDPDDGEALDFARPLRRRSFALASHGNTAVCLSLGLLLTLGVAAYTCRAVPPWAMPPWAMTN